MARQIVVLALIFVAIIGCESVAPVPTTSDAAAAVAPSVDASTPSASASSPSATTASPPTPDTVEGALSPTESSASSPTDSPVGNTNEEVIAGGPAPGPSATEKKSGASALGFSAVTGAAAVAGYFLF